MKCHIDTRFGSSPKRHSIRLSSKKKCANESVQSYQKSCLCQERARFQITRTSSTRLLGHYEGRRNYALELVQKKSQHVKKPTRFLLLCSPCTTQRLVAHVQNAA